MFIQIDDERVIFASRQYGDGPGVRVIDRSGREERHSLEGRYAAFRTASDGTLLLRHEKGVAVVDPASGFSMRELSETSPTDVQNGWTASYLGVVVDTVRGCFARFEIDEAALRHDPETGPTDAVLLPDGRRVAIMIHKTPHIAIFDPDLRTTELVSLEQAHSGGSKAVIRDGVLWFVCYDTLFRLDLASMALSASEVLQPPFRDGPYDMMTSGFVGVPRYSSALSGWLIPRPYSGDILVISPDSLQPRSRIKCGGRPYDAVEFDDGALLVLDHPFDVVRPAHIRDAQPV